MKTTKRIFCIFLATVSILLLLVGCKDNSLPVDRVVAETDTHRVFYSNEKCYIEFFEKLDYENDSPIMASSSPAYVTVQNAGELVNKILENDFTFAQKQMIYRATTDENGKIDRCIFDIEKMYQPVFPENSEFQQLAWDGYRYTYTVRYADSFPVYFEVFEKDDYAEFYQRYVTDEISGFESKPDKYTITQLDDGNAVEYRGDRRKCIIYNVEEGEKQITVKEEYHISESFDDIVSETVPYSITMYITEGDANYCISIQDPYKHFAEHPGEEWLLSFGMEPYVPAGE